MSKAKVTLIGAGPGDPDLISLKGVKALKEADVVLFDALVHPELLQHAPDSAKRIYVGKRKGHCQFHQKDINQMIVDKAFEHGHVVRLKGGDPFIFGRGHEELEFVKSNGIEVQVIPGISSCYSVPESLNIPLTKRGFSESFWVITGTTKEHQLSKDVYDAAKSNATVVILMGMNNLPQIVDIFIQNGKSDLPIAIIQNGTFKTEQFVMGQIKNIVNKVIEDKISNPAIIVIGEVVRTHPNLVLQESVTIQNQKDFS